jgi:hypothetical protein
VLDAVDAVAVAGQPRDRADRAGREDEPVGVVRVLQRASQLDRHRDTGHVVVGQRRVADVAGHDDLVVDLAAYHVLGVGQGTVRQR